MVPKAVNARIGIFPGRTTLSNWAKRAFDIAVSLTVLILLAPFFLLFALAIKRDSPGPVFYRGRRIGLGGKEFSILKFRTMYEDPKSYAGPKVTAHDDDRITALGRWLRDTKINEFPQFWNVLKGDMSMVGPRPEDPDIVASWPREAYNEILSVRPGITSPASVQYHNEEALLSSDNVLQKYMKEVGPDKLRLDQLYVRYRSFWLDMDVILWTALILLPMVGSQEVPEDMLFLGPISRIFRRFFNWFTVDTLTTFAALATAGVIWRFTAPLNIGWPKAIALGFGFSILFSTVGFLMGVNRISWRKATFADAIDLFPAWLLAAGLATGINWYYRIFPVSMILFASALALGGFISMRYRSRLMRMLMSKVRRTRATLSASRERVLIIGAGPTAHHIASLLRHPTNTNRYWLVGFIHNDLFYQGMRIYGAHVLGNIKDIPRLMDKFDVGVVILADHQVYANEYSAIQEMLASYTARLLVIPDVLYTLNSLVKYNRLPVNVIEKSTASMLVPATGTENACPCTHCLASYAPMKVSAMINEVDRALEAGDIDTAKQWIQKIRRSNETEKRV